MLAARLARLDKQLGPDEQARLEKAAGRPLARIVRDLFDAADADRIEAAARAATGQIEPDDAAMNAASDKLMSEAVNVLTGPWIELLDSIRRTTSTPSTTTVLRRCLPPDGSGT